VIQICGFVVVALLPDFAASGSVAARHGFSLKREPDARHQNAADTSACQVPADGQYQPEAWDFAHAPHGVPYRPVI
jgi:hypothetical protein